MNEVKTFVTGGLNYDTDLHSLPQTDWIDAVNVRMAASDSQQEAAASNIEGNVRIGDYELPTGDNKCIGAYSDEFRNVVYAFIWNSNGLDEILEISPENGSIVPVFRNMIWTGDVDITQFESYNKIHSIDILHRADDEGDLLFWTDGNTRPRKINIKRAKAFGTPEGYPAPIIMGYTLVAKEPPPSPTLLYQNDLDRISNNLRGKLFQFQIRWVYDDYEKSTWSGWGEFEIPLVPFEKDRNADPTINNNIKVDIATGGALVKKIELGVRQNNESVWGDLFLIETLDKEKLGISDNILYQYFFYNDTSGVLQPPADVNQVWDYVPTRAGCQALVNGNTLAYGDVTEGVSFNGVLDVKISYEMINLGNVPGDDVLIYKLNSKYRFGLVYFDEFKRTDGVHTYVLTDGSDDDFEIDTGGYEADGVTDSYNIKRPILRAEIYHQPPIWAKTYKWVRTSSLTYSKFLYYIMLPIGSGDSDNFYFHLDPFFNSITWDGQNALSYDFVPGDRIKILRRMAIMSPGAQDYNLDLEIQGVLDNPIIANEEKQGKFLKVRKNTQAIPLTTAYYLVEIYSPSRISDNTQFFYEFGEEYAILNPGDPATMAHAGLDQDQDVSTNQPAVFSRAEWSRGDVYLRPRERMEYKAGSTYDQFINIPVEDPNFSDKFPSAVSGNGRGYIVDNNQREQRLPSIIRFGGSYIQDTFINKTNNFPAANIVDTCDRSFGAIKRLTVRDRQLRVFQEYKCGWVPINQNVLQTAAGNSIVSQSDQLLNNIQYYEGNFGIGNAACSLASQNFADYFHDTNRGVICRLSRDGLTPISITSKMNRFAITEDVKYKSVIYNGPYPPDASDIPGRAQIYGVFDTKNNEYISAYERIRAYPDGGDPITLNEPKTLSWDEVRNRFVSSYLYYPEWMSCLKNDIITFVSGVPYIHNNKDDRCNFYGAQTDWALELVFNEKFALKKTFQALDLVSNVPMSTVLIETSLNQNSDLVQNDLVLLEGHWQGAFLRDASSPGGILEGDFLKGGYVKIRLQKSAAGALILLNSAAVRYIISQLNNQ